MHNRKRPSTAPVATNFPSGLQSKQVMSRWSSSGKYENVSGVTEDVSPEPGGRFQMWTSASFVLLERQFYSMVHNVEADQPSCKNVRVCWAPTTHKDLSLLEKKTR